MAETNFSAAPEIPTDTMAPDAVLMRLGFSPTELEQLHASMGKEYEEIEAQVWEDFIASNS
jgi:hypothetical protein